MNKAFTKDSLIKQPAIELFQSLGYSHQDCFHEIFGEKGMYSGEIDVERLDINE